LENASPERKDIQVIPVVRLEPHLGHS
jgi:hypothetical protein